MNDRTMISNGNHHQHAKSSSSSSDPPPPRPSISMSCSVTTAQAATGGDDHRSSAGEQDIDKDQTYSTRVLWITYVNIVLYALCYQLQRPVEPFLVQELSEHQSNKNTTISNSTATTYGQLQSFFSFIQTIGSPLVGILLDRLGIRYASAMVFLSSALSYGLLSQAKTMHMLFITKVPTILQHAFLVAQAVAATSCQNDEPGRAQALGRMTTAYTIGATIGPALGGSLAAHGDFYLGAKLAVVGSLVSVILSLVFLPNVVSNNDNNNNRTSMNVSSAGGDKQHQQKQQRSIWQEIRHSAAMASRSSLWPLLLVKIVSGFATSMFQTTLPMVLTAAPIALDPAQLGLTMSAGMFASAIFGAFGLASLTERLGGAMGMTKMGLLLRPILGWVMALLLLRGRFFFHRLLLLLGGGTGDLTTISIVVVTIAHSLTSHFIATGLTTQTTGAVAADEQGALLGLEHGLFSLARVGAPTLGTALLTMSSFTNVTLCCGVVDIALWGLLTQAAYQIGSCGGGTKTKAR